ncbi:unnamed protein product [Darwinula stevensoni]|uniref:Cullin family profile domain-containing protein n=1 Tax=Darwinula stevensoni TaxID=69355 RepID=A0A7R8XGG9_9CRUS|nr:unnamed protein product [Darwinula stevensoni]CAG0892522.1 unnamed protein product [Darwinula stevensoni]
MARVLTQSDISKPSDLRPTSADFGCLRNDFQRNEPTRLNPAIRRTGPRGSAGVDLLQTLVLAWTDHKISLTIMSDILGYLDRVYVPQSGVEDVIKYGEIKEQLKEALSDMVTRERRGEAVDRSMIRDITTMLAMLGGDIYRKVFEEPFLQQAVEFYRVKSRNFLVVRPRGGESDERIEGGSLALREIRGHPGGGGRIHEESQMPPLESTASDIQPYIRHVRAWTEREARRASRYGVGKRALRRAMTDALIRSNMDAIVAPSSFPALQQESPEIARMLRDGSADELRSKYDLHSSVPEGSNITAKCVSAYLRERGRALAAEAEGPVSHLQSLLDLKKQLDDLLRSSFGRDRLVEEAITREFQQHLALDPRSAERLSLFIDHAMKRGEEGMTEPENEAAHDEATALFRLLPEKEAFQRCYERHLAKRLLLESVSDGIEGSMISRLKAECGSQYTAKLEVMLKDIAVSNAITTEMKHRFASTGENQPGLDLTVRVLTAGIWPARPVAPECAVPVEALAAFEAFRRFYLSLHSGRKLTLRFADPSWGCTQLGSANLKATFYEPRREDGEAGDRGSSFARLDSRRPSPGSALSSARPDGGSVAAWGGQMGRAQHHVIQVSTFQMCILMLFNDRSRISYSHNPLTTEVPEQLKGRLLPSPVVLEKRIKGLIEREYLDRRNDDRELYTYVA